MLMSSASAASMYVVSPGELSSKFLSQGEVQAHLGNYGHIHYGDAIMGKLHYPVQNRDGCQPFNKAMFTNDALFDTDDDRRPIALLDHGGCTHVVKTWNAQQFGMKGAVIVDDHDKDFAGLKENEAQRTADAKKGFQLVIPYLKVNSQDGLLFREYL